MNAWDHLPNAKHIDRVLASLKEHPEKWNAALDAAYYVASAAAWGTARSAAWYAARDAARDAAWHAARDAARSAAWGTARGAAWKAAWSAAWSAITGLIAYDDCAHLLDSTPDDLRILHALGEERAILFIPATIVFTDEFVNIHKVVKHVKN